MPRFTTSDGLGIAYRDEGDRSGLPVLCIPGLTRNLADFDPVAGHLADVRLVRITCRGRGDSDRDPDYRNYSVPVEARDCLELLDHLAIDRAAVLGTSRGGLIAMYLALVARNRLAGVLLNDIGPVLEPEGLEPIVDYLGKQPEHGDLDHYVENLATRSKGFVGVGRERWEEQARNIVIQTSSGLRINYDPRLRDAVLEQSMDAVDPWAWFRALGQLPTALVRGANSDLLSRETASRMREMRPDMVFAEVPDRGHVPFLDEPESIAAIRKWLERCAEDG